tara:strand:+ start:10881 stop:12056 length:1176 start_codon:yes stop_codon:yes gene_type:complete
MAFSPFVVLDDNEISNLAFEYTRHPYIYYTDYKKLAEVFSVNKKTFKQIQKLFNGDALLKVKTKDKVYICPGCKLPQFRIKEYLRTIKATMTREIEKATIIISTDAMCDNVDNGYRANKQARTNKFYFIDDGMFCINKYDSSRNHNETEQKYYSTILDNLGNVGERIRNNNIEDVTKILLSANTIDSISWNNTMVRRDDDDENKWYLYPIVMKVIYEILSKKIPVIHEDTFSEYANSGLKLNDQNVFESIKMMMNGTTEDITLAVEMICNSDFSNAEHELYYLANTHGNLQYRNRNKNLEYFISASKYMMFAGMSKYEFIQYLKEEDLLTKEAFSNYYAELVDNCLDGLKYNHFEDMFNIRISLKDDWLTYADVKEKETSYENDNKENEEE